MSLKNAWGGVALIASTAIGAAILALPISTAHLGAVQSTLLFLLCWFFMTMGALYLLETNLAVGYGANLISMADKTLGPYGKGLTWVIYLLLLYALTAAHLVGASAWLHSSFQFYEIHFSPLRGAILTSMLITLVLLLDTLIIDWLNRFLMIGLMSIFFTLISASLPHIKLPLLLSQSLLVDLRPLPLIITAFGSAIVIPTLTDYLKGNGRQLVRVVVVGSLIPLGVYLLWEWTILGIIPVNQLLAIQQYGHPVTDVPATLQSLLHHPWISQAASYFSVFALIASFLGLCVSLLDFLADGLKIKKNFRGKLLLAFITFFPPLIFLAFYNQGFTIILSLAGLFVALLLGILPALMVWQVRYRLHLPSVLRVSGGKPLLLGTAIFFLLITIIELFNQCEATYFL